jgi:hypothetical protein
MSVSIGKFCIAFFGYANSINGLASIDERQESGVQDPYGVPEFHTLSFKT